MAANPLSWLSVSDLEALNAGDLSKVSDQGLKLLDGGGKGGSVAENAGMGFLRGAKDVVDTGAQWLSSGVDKLTGGSEGARVRDMNEAGKRDFQADYGGSTAASVGRVGGNIAATLPLGGFVGAGLRAAAPLTGSAAPIVSALGNAIGSGGMRTGLPQAGLKDLAIRSTGGAVAGGLQAGAVDPSSAGTGMLIGGVAPPVFRGLGIVGDALGSVIRGPAANQGVREAAQLAQQQGYVIPPTQVAPTLVNRVLEGTAGKISTAQNASARNQEVTNRLAAESLGLPAGTAVSPFVLQDLRKDAGSAYQAMSGLPLKPATQAQPLMNRAATPEINPMQMVEDLKQARNDAQAYFKSYNRSANPEELKKARAADALGKQLESGLEDYAGSLGKPDLLNNLRDARQQIAKTYSVERALNQTTGNVDAQTLAKLLQKKVPLSGGLLDAAQFAQAFPKAAQPLEKMGSLPQFSPLDLTAAIGSAGLSAVTSNPYFLAASLLRPSARYAALSGPVQRGLLDVPGAGQGLLTGGNAQQIFQLGARAAPQLGVSR